MILNWALVKGRIQPDEDTEADADTDAPGDLELTGGLKDDFWHDLYYYNIHLRFISGPWGTDLFHASEDVDFGWKEAGELSQDRNLILTSETIYSPASLPSLVDTLDIFLPHPGSLCLLAAKQVYFGVGGGIDEFKALMWQRRQGKDQGSIQMSTVKETKGLNGVARVVLRIETGQDA